MEEEGENWWRPKQTPKDYVMREKRHVAYSDIPSFPPLPTVSPSLPPSPPPSRLRTGRAQPRFVGARVSLLGLPAPAALVAAPTVSAFA